MKYLITSWYDGAKYEEEISGEKYKILKASKEKILETIAIEEKFDILLENYKEFEKSLFSIALQKKMQQQMDRESRLDQARELSRFISNLLSSAKLYLDHLMGHISAIYSKSSKEYQSVIECKKKHYDNNFSYRLLEALRNHVQHAGLPFTYSEYSSWHTERNSMVNISTPVLDINELRENKKFKRTVLNEMSDNEKEIDLKNHIRAYIGSISEINEHVRELVSENYIQWEELISIEISRCNHELKVKNDRSVSLKLLIENDDKTRGNNIALFMSFLKLRYNYISKNKVLVNFDCRYISTIEEELFKQLKI